MVTKEATLKVKLEKSLRVQTGVNKDKPKLESINIKSIDTFHGVILTINKKSN